MSDAAYDPVDFTTAALTYARRGWRVLPVQPGEKRPILRDWPERASTDPKQIYDWWIGQPHANIGIATGPASGFWVLDIDPKNGGDLALSDLITTHGALPLTHIVRTGSGGWHHYFLMPDFEVTNSPGSLKGTGIDVRGAGGQVLAPPSVTALGQYEVNMNAPLAPAPDWLLDLIRPEVRLQLVGGTAVEATVGLERYVTKAIEAAVLAVRTTSAGGRNQELNNQVMSLAGIAHHVPEFVSRDVVLGHMMTACQANGLAGDDGPTSVINTFDSAWTAGLKRPRHQWPPVGSAAVSGAPAAADGRPVVETAGRKHNEIVDEVLINLSTANTAEPRLFAHGTEVAQVIGQPARTVTLDANMLMYEADVAMHFEKAMPKGGSAIVNAPVKVVDTIMSMPVKPFPVLTRISYTPYFAPSGRYVAAPGYDGEAETFYAPALGVEVKPIPETPTPAQVAQARRYIDENLLADFPFVGPADRANAWALMLLPFVRDMIAGPTPLHNIEAPTPGSGKGLLMKALLMAGVGGRHATVSAPQTDEEWQKALVAYLRLTPQAIVIDNVNEKVTSGALCTTLTEPEVTARMLGYQTSITVPVRTTWVMTANNPRFSDEVARRAIRIRLDANVERPEDRTGFRHSDLARWAREHRGNLILAVCTMVQGWVRAGKPENVPARPFGSFEHWHGLMGGLLDFIGVPGLIENKADFLAAGDDETNAWTQLVMLLKRDEMREWTSAEIAEEVTANGIAIDLGRGGNEALMMGRQLGRQRDRWHAGRRFEKRTVNGKTWWRLVGKPSL